MERTIFMKKRIWFIVLISCLLCGCIRKDRTSDSQLMDSRDVDSTEENENVKEDDDAPYCNGQEPSLPNRVLSANPLLLQVFFYG